MNDIDRLISGYLDGSLSDAEIDELGQWILADRANARAFTRAVSVHAGIADWVHSRVDGNLISGLQTDKATDDASETWFDMLALIDSGQAALVELPPPPDATEQVPEPYTTNAQEEPEYKQVFGFAGIRLYRRHPSRGLPPATKYLGWAAMLAVAAALLWIILNPGGTEDAPPLATQTPTEQTAIASLTRTIDAQWGKGSADINGEPLAIDAKLKAGGLLLERGIIELTLEQGTSVVIEAPSAIRLIDGNRIELTHGRVVANVPERASGFTIDTASAQIIDLGTEFGVEVGRDGVVSTAVFEGKAIVAEHAEADGTERREVPLSAGWQIDVNAEGRIDRDVRKFDPVVMDQRFSRRVAKRINLVDVVAGGDGTGSSTDRGIDMMTGAFTDNALDGRPESDWRYDDPPIGWVPVDGSGLIDGVFTPLEQSVRIDSAGHIYERLEANLRKKRYGFGPLWAGASLPLTQQARHVAPVLPFKRWGYEHADRSLLLMHAPKGITFDLHALTDAHAGLTPDRITALVYNAGNDTRSTENDPRVAEAGFFVIVDGQFLFQKRSVFGDDQPISFDLPIPEGARFLTLITDLGPRQQVEFDWVLIGNPTIEMVPAEEE